VIWSLIKKIKDKKIMKLKNKFLSLFYGCSKKTANCCLAAAICWLLTATGAANAAVTIRPVNVSSGAGSVSASPSSSSLSRVSSPTRSGTPIRIGTTFSNSGTAGTRGSSNSIGKYLNSSSSALRPGSSIKIPTTIIGGGGGNVDLSNYVTQEQYNYLENVVNNLELNADLSNYYNIPETDELLDEKLFRDDLIAGDNITIIDDASGGKIISSTGGGEKGDKGDKGDTGDTGPIGPTGAAGDDGREVVIRNDSDVSGYLQWQYAGDDTWNNLVDVASLQGADGLDGQEVEMRFDADTSYIQWRLHSKETQQNSWINLLDVAALGNNSNKADKVAGAVGGNIAGLTDIEGNLTDTGIAADSVLVLPGADELTAGDGGYTIIVNRVGQEVTGPVYMKVY
jgi:hypothetical protein